VTEREVDIGCRGQQPGERHGALAEPEGVQPLLEHEGYGGLEEARDDEDGEGERDAGGYAGEEEGRGLGDADGGWGWRGHGCEYLIAVSFSRGWERMDKQVSV
jgi:hypothetical protein